MQNALEFAPNAALNVAGGQSLHFAEPVDSLYVPSEQGRQLAGDVAPALGLKVPAGHVMQSAGLDCSSSTP